MADAGNGRALDLDSMTVAELRALASAAEAKAQEKVEAEKRAILDDARAKLAALGLSLEVGAKGQQQGTGAARAGADGKGKPQGPGPGKLPVKYRSPDGQEWSGRGKVPLWLSEAEKQGKSRDDFLAQKVG